MHQIQGVHSTRNPWPVANSVIEIRKIDSADNYADPFTKALTSNEHHGFFYEVLCN
jgi:hypothetical protein